MKRISLAVVLLCVTLLLLPSIGSAQSKQQGDAILKQANELRANARSKEDRENALKKYEEALRIFERVGADKEKGTTFNQIGTVLLLFSGQHHKALEYYEKSLAIWRKKEEMFRVKTSSTNEQDIGGAYSSLGQYQKALEYYEKWLAITRKTGNVQSEGYTLSNIGYAYCVLGELQKALEYYGKAFDIFKRIGDVRGECNTCNQFTVAYRILGQYQKALEYNDKSLERAKRIGSHPRRKVGR